MSMITFTDPRLYVQGIGTVIMTDIATGDIKYFSDKIQEGALTVAADDGIINAGIGSGPAIMIPSNPNVQVAITAADYNEYAKSAAANGKLSYGAPDMVCQTITATGTTLSVDVTKGTPVAGPGMEKIVAYVQEVGAESPIASGGIAYEVNPTSGAINGFVATNGKTYLVTYHVSRANASMTTYTTNTKGKVVRFVMQRPVYVNVDPSTKSGDLYGMLYEIVPRLQLMPDGASNSGNQTTPTTTGITGRAMAYDADTISADCTECALNGAPLMYRILVPCDAESGIEGIVGVIGGAITVAVGQSIQLNPAVIVRNTLSYSVPPTDFTYVSSATSVATVGASTGIVTGAATGSAEITVRFGSDELAKFDFINVEVVSA